MAGQRSEELLLLEVGISLNARCRTCVTPVAQGLERRIVRWIYNQCFSPNSCRREIKYGWVQVLKVPEVQLPDEAFHL
jgi:hypothetical protein